MAHMLHRAQVFPAVTNLWHRQVAQSSLVALLAKVAPPVTASPGLLSLRDWHAFRYNRVVHVNSRAHARFRSSAARADAVIGKHKVVFLGTPEVAADVLYKLIEASKDRRSTFEIAATVTQPGKPRKPNRKTGEIPPPKPSPVAQIATHFIPSAQLLTPKSAKEEDFLEALRALQPDLCVTAAYGNFLPKAFLQIPKFGTVNIHPSLLPKYRGAAPVQRALQNGEKQIGVCLLYTVHKMDAGPIIAQETVEVDEGLQAHELLCHLFSIGTRLLLDNMSAIWSGEAAEQATAQAGRATTASKLDRKESKLDWSQDARTIHNKVRAFAPWPGTAHSFVKKSDSGSIEHVPVKILKTRVCKSSEWPDIAESQAAAGESKDECVAIDKKDLYVKCGDGKWLSILKLQIPGKKPIDSVDFINGLQGRTLHLSSPECSDTD